MFNDDEARTGYSSTVRAFIKNEQKDPSTPRPTYSGDVIIRLIARSVTAATAMVCARVPETEVTYDGVAMGVFLAPSAGSITRARSKNVDMSKWSPNMEREPSIERTLNTTTLTGWFKC